MTEHATEGTAAGGVYLALRIASWVALVSIVLAIGWAAWQAILYWNVISV